MPVAGPAAGPVAGPAAGPFAAIIVAGGAGRRLGGQDKRHLDVAGATLLEHALAAASGATQIVVVGREVPGGPVAAISAGLAQVFAPKVAILAVDQPMISGGLEPLRCALPGHDVALLVRNGRYQHLAAVWQCEALAAALARLGEPAGAPMWKLLEGARIAEVKDEADWSFDVDTPADLEAVRRRLLATKQER